MLAHRAFRAPQHRRRRIIHALAVAIDTLTVRFHLQQLEMESNGKRVDRNGKSVDYATAPVLWGAEGTVSQHSLHQLLHQGTQVVPCDFIELGLERNLSANAQAQADALAFGTNDPKLPPHRQYPGNRPSSMLALDGLNARNV